MSETPEELNFWKDVKSYVYAFGVHPAWTRWDEKSQKKMPRALDQQSLYRDIKLKILDTGLDDAIRRWREKRPDLDD